MVEPSRQYDLPAKDFAAWEVPAVEAAVRAFLALNRSIPGYDFEDLAHDCLAEWWEKRKTYDPNRGANPKTWLNRVVHGHLVDLLRAATSQGRGRNYRTLSLDAPLDADDADSDTLHDLLAGTIEGSDPAQAIDGRLLAQAVARIRDRLSAVEQESLDDFLAGLSPTDIERLRGVKRTTASSRRRQLVRGLRNSGLHEFLDEDGPALKGD